MDLSSPKEFYKRKSCAIYSGTKRALLVKKNCKLNTGSKNTRLKIKK